MPRLSLQYPDAVGPSGRSASVPPWLHHSLPRTHPKTNSDFLPGATAKFSVGSEGCDNSLHRGENPYDRCDPYRPRSLLINFVSKLSMAKGPRHPENHRLWPAIVRRPNRGITNPTPNEYLLEPDDEQAEESRVEMGGGMVRIHKSSWSMRIRRGPSQWRPRSSTRNRGPASTQGLGLKSGPTRQDGSPDP